MDPKALLERLKVEKIAQGAILLSQYLLDQTFNQGRLWSRLKTEELEARDWPVFTDLASAQASVANYFNYYNPERRHSRLTIISLISLTNSNLIISSVLSCLIRPP